MLFNLTKEKDQINHVLSTVLWSAVKGHNWAPVCVEQNENWVRFSQSHWCTHGVIAKVRLEVNEPHITSLVNSVNRLQRRWRSHLSSSESDDSNDAQYKLTELETLFGRRFAKRLDPLNMRRSHKNVILDVHETSMIHPWQTCRRSKHFSISCAYAFLLAHVLSLVTRSVYDPTSKHGNEHEASFLEYPSRHH